MYWLHKTIWCYLIEEEKKETIINSWRYLGLVVMIESK